MHINRFAACALLQLFIIVLVQFSLLQFTFTTYEQQNASRPIDNMNIQFSQISTDEILWNGKSKPDTPPHSIDVVITWAGRNTRTKNKRLRNNGELQYCLRSIYENIGWFNHIYIVVNNRTYDDVMGNLTFINPASVTMKNKLSLITHFEIFNNKSNIINQRNSNAIESNLHHIPNLSPYYIYFNDDMFIGQRLSWRYFFTQRDGTRLVPRVPYIVHSAYMFGENWWNIFRLHSIESITSPYIDTLPCSKRNDIPFNNHKSMMRHYMVHSPLPFYKSDWMQFEKEYSTFFHFMESQKKRKINCQNKDVGVMKHFIRKQMNGDLKIDVMYLKYYDYLFAALVKYYKHYAVQRSWNNYWIFGSKVGNLGMFKQHLKTITRRKPLTFCINDDFPIEHADHLREFTNFLEAYFPKKSSVEK